MLILQLFQNSNSFIRAFSVFIFDDEVLPFVTGMIHISDEDCQ